MPNRRSIESAIENLTAQHAASGKVIDVKKAAAAILARYPEGGLTLDQIARQIEESALRNHAVILRGTHPPR